MRVASTCKPCAQHVSPAVRRTRIAHLESVPLLPRATQKSPTSRSGSCNYAPSRHVVVPACVCEREIAVRVRRVILVPVADLMLARGSLTPGKHSGAASLTRKRGQHRAARGVALCRTRQKLGEIECHDSPFPGGVRVRTIR